MGLVTCRSSFYGALGTCLVLALGQASARPQDDAPEFVAQWGRDATPDGEFDPLDIAADLRGNLYVIHRYPVDVKGKEESRYHIRKFDRSGRFLTEWGDFGTGDREFKMATSVFVDAKGFIYTSDGQTEQVQKFTSEGKLVGRFGAKGSKDGQSK